MKKILILGLLLVSHLWGLKELGSIIYSNREEWCLETHPEEESRNWCETKTSTLPNDYKPTKEDKVLKVKVGNVEGEIVGIRKNDRSRTWFIRSNKGDYKYIVGSLFDGKDMLINYPNYAIMAHSWIIESEVNLAFYQIFQVGNELKIFGLKNVVTLCGNFYRTDPCPNPLDYLKHLSTQDILKKIEELGGQEYFDYACPEYYDDLNEICDQGIIRGRRDGEYERRDRITG